MIHKCEYCDKTQTPCNTPCRLKGDKNHVCCTCDINSDTCELESKIVCDNANCQLELKLDFYKIEFDKLHTELARAKAALNAFRIANIGAESASKLIAEGVLEITGIRSFWTKQKLTWDEISDEDGYTMMVLYQEGAQMWASFLHDRKVKLTIKKEIIKKTQENLKKADEIRAGISNSDGSRKSKNAILKTLNPKETIVYHNMKSMGLSFKDAVASAELMGIKGECRDLNKLGLFDK